jgi:hypothetical protein
MKTKSFTIAVLGALVLVALLVPRDRVEHQALAAGSAVVLANAQTTTGPGIASGYTAATPGEVGSENLLFVFRAAGTNAARAQAHLEISDDSGSTWTGLHTFGTGSDVFRYPVCAVCTFRVVSDYASSTATVTVTMSVSGAAVAIAPTRTPTPTPTVTPTH